MITALVVLWLLMGFLAALITSRQDRGIPLPAFIAFCLFGGFSLLVVIIEILSDIEI